MKIHLLLKTYYFMLLAVAQLGLVGYVQATEVSCSNYSATITASCNQCFDEGSVYAGEGVNSFLDIYTNRNADEEIIFKDTWGTFSYTVLQQGSGFSDTGNFMQFTPNLAWYILNGREYTVFAPNAKTEFLRFAPGHGIKFESASNTMDRKSPALRVEVITNTQLFSKGVLNPTFYTLKACAFLTPRWCGDGVVDSAEMCDAGTNNGQVGSTCSRSCLVTPVINLKVPK